MEALRSILGRFTIAAFARKPVGRTAALGILV
jgi:hypothetical protein